MGRTQLERAAKQRCFLSGLYLIHCLHYFVGGVMGSSPDWDTLWPFAPGQREPCTHYLRVWHKTQQRISEDLLQSGGAAVPGSGKCPRISSQSSGFVAQLQPRCPGGTSGLPGPPGTSSSLRQDKRTHAAGWKARALSQVQQHHQDPSRRAVVLMSLQL